MKLNHLNRLGTTLALTFFSSVTLAEEMTIPAGRDNTIFEDQNATSNGQGDLFVGTSGEGISRRALMYFDVAASVPDGATINSASLNLNVGRASGDSGEQMQSLYRLTADWGEGDSASTSGGMGGGNGGGGAGADAATDDVTWTFRFFDDAMRMWMLAGGDFIDTPSATASVPMAEGAVTWSSNTLTADVQAWLDAPAENFGWILIGDEETPGTSRRYSSRESDDNTPMLTIDYTPAANGGSSMGGICGLGLMLPLMLCVPGLMMIRRSNRR